MVNYQDLLTPQVALEIIDARIDALVREAYSHFITGRALDAQTPGAGAPFLKHGEDLNPSLEAILIERERWQPGEPHEPDSQ